jgi:hypothetical protein
VRKAPLKRRRQPRGYKEPGRLAFRIQVLSGSECLMAGRSRERCGGILDPHHVIAKQALKKHGLSSQLWNADNGIPLCRRHHERHETAVERVPRSLLPAEALAFAEELGLEYLLDRYPEST